MMLTIELIFMMLGYLDFPDVIRFAISNKKLYSTLQKTRMPIYWKNDTSDLKLFSEYKNDLEGTIRDIRSELVRICFTFIRKTSKQYIFGGFVRDSIAGVPWHDIDICSVSTRTRFMRLFEYIKNSLPKFVNVTYKTSLQYLNNFTVKKIIISVNHIKITSIDYVYFKNIPLKRVKVDYDVNTLFTDGEQIGSMLVRRHGYKEKMPWEVIEEISTNIRNKHACPISREANGHQPIHRVLKMMNKGFKVY